MLDTILRSFSLILLLFLLFAFITGISLDVWSTERLLQIFQSTPDIFTSVQDFFRKFVETIHIDPVDTGISWLTDFLNLFIDMLNFSFEMIAFVGFLVSGLVQVLIFIFYFVRFLFSVS